MLVYSEKIKISYRGHWSVPNQSKWDKTTVKIWFFKHYGCLQTGRKLTHHNLMSLFVSALKMLSYFIWGLHQSVCFLLWQKKKDLFGPLESSDVLGTASFPFKKNKINGKWTIGYCFLFVRRYPLTVPLLPPGGESRHPSLPKRYRVTEASFKALCTK